MKKIVYGVFLFLIALITLLYLVYSPVTGFLNNYIYFSYCDKPVGYRIGAIDNRFNITTSGFLRDIRQAEQIWENINSKNMFEYDAGAKLSFNMQYDRRQTLTTQINDLEGKLDSGKSTLNQSIQEYEGLAANYNQRLEDFNKRVSYWNSLGGAPPDEFDKLTAQEQEIKAEASKLNAMAGSLNLSTREYNSQVGELNQTIESFRKEISLRPEEGLYDGEAQRITIYITNSQDELIHTLAHEMGHALGIEHVENKEAIMFPFSTTQSSPSVEDKKALDYVCRKQNKFEIFLQNLSTNLRELARQYNISI